MKVNKHEAGKEVIMDMKKKKRIKEEDDMEDETEGVELKIEDYGEQKERER